MMDGYASVQVTSRNPSDLLFIMLTSHTWPAVSHYLLTIPCLPLHPLSPLPSPVPPGPPPHSHSLTITEMWRMCICSSTISEGSCRVGAVAWASCPELLMETWKYKVPFSSHCCLQCTSEMSAAVPDISARQDPRGWVSCMPGLGALGREGATPILQLRMFLPCTRMPVLTTNL